MALRWSAIHPAAAPDRTYEAILGLNKAADFEDFRAGLSLYGGPSQNFVYADVDGHIGYQLPGYVPIRSDPGDRGDRPVLGSTGNGEWLGRIPFEQLPSVLDPVDGWIVTANNAVVDAADPRFLGQEWDPGYRAERIIDLLNHHAEDGLTVPDMGLIQADTSPLRARDIVLWLDEALPATPDGFTIADRIATWDGRCTLDSFGCSAYMAWEYRILRDLFDDELGPLARDYVGSPWSWVALEQLIQDPGSPWWDDTTTPTVETADVIALRAMDEAGAELRAAFGDPDSWDWARLHTATFQEATIGTGSGIGPLEWYFNEGPEAVAGHGRYRQQHLFPPEPRLSGPDGSRVRADRHRSAVHGHEPALVSVAPGHLRSRWRPDRHHDGTVRSSLRPIHYDDQIEPWRNDDTLPLPFTRDAIAGGHRRDPHAQPMSAPAADVVVVGAGTMGAWTALRSRRAGWRTTLIDAFGAGHPRSTSGDETRIMRAAHGADTFYTRWSREARTAWQAFEAEVGERFFVAAGDALVRPSRGRVRGRLDRGR